MAVSAFVLFVLAAQTAAADRGRSSEAADVDVRETFRPLEAQTTRSQPPDSPLARGGDGRRAERGTTLERVTNDALSAHPRPDDDDHYDHRQQQQQQQQHLVNANSSSTSSRDYSDPVDEEVADADEADEATAAATAVDDDDDDERHDGGHGGGHGGGHHEKGKKKKKKNKKKKKKTKKGHHGFFSLMKKLKKQLPHIAHKMHGPSMFMLGMAQANFHNFVMHALMMSKMALTTVVVMILREMVFGDKDQPVKYYNFGYDHHRRTLPYHYGPYDYKRRRKRRAA